MQTHLTILVILTIRRTTMAPTGSNNRMKSSFHTGTSSASLYLDTLPKSCKLECLRSFVVQRKSLFCNMTLLIVPRIRAYKSKAHSAIASSTHISTGITVDCLQLHQINLQ